MPKFRKKPVEIEARQFIEGAGDEIAEWCGGMYGDSFVYGPCVAINTLEGVMRALPGDWIIRGVAGEFYPCKPEIFRATYELVQPC
jgi:hypothetical protein